MMAILHNLRSQHNVGSIFRTTAAAGIVEKIFCCGITPAPLDEFKRPRRQLLKVSLGAERIMPWEKVGRSNYKKLPIAPTLKVINQLQNKGFQIICLEQNHQAIPYYQLKLSLQQLKRTALVVGHETRGLSLAVLRQADKILEIPLPGEKKSLNVAIALAIVVFYFIATLPKIHKLSQ